MVSGEWRVEMGKWKMEKGNGSSSYTHFPFPFSHNHKKKLVENQLFFVMHQDF